MNDAATVICVIDDDELVRATICAALEGDGYATVQAGDGQFGIDALRRSKAQLAIIDIIMPNKEGVETIMEAKMLFPGIKILAISGGGSEPKGDLLALANEFGADACLTKPFRNVDLLAKVAQLLALP